MMSKVKSLLPWAMLPTVFSLAWPTMLEQLLGTAVQYIDTAMVGTLGTAATAAVGATTTVNWLFGSTISAIGVGFLAFVSQALGEGNKKLVKVASSQAVLAVIVLGVIFTVLPLALSPFVPIWMQVDESVQYVSARYFFIIYTPMLARCATIIFGTILRAAGDTKTPMRVGLLVNIVNVSLNFLFIYPTRTVKVFGFDLNIWGLGEGVVGAAVATAIAIFVGGVCIAVVFFRHPDVSPRGVPLKPNGEVLRPCLKVALPNAMQRFATSFGYVAFAAMVNSLGEVATAAHTIANTVESAFYIPGYGMQTAAATLAGNAKGASDDKKLRELSRMLIFLEVLMMVASGALLFAFAPSMMRIFSKEAAVIILGATVLRMVAVSEPFYGVSIVIEGMMQGMGRTVMPFVANVIGMWFIRIVGTFICVYFLDGGLVSAWACMILHNLSLFAVFLIYYLRGNIRIK